MWTDGSQFLPNDCLTLVGASPAGRESVIICVNESVTKPGWVTR